MDMEQRRDGVRRWFADLWIFARVVADDGERMSIRVLTSPDGTGESGSGFCLRGPVAGLDLFFEVMRGGVHEPLPIGGWALIEPRIRAAAHRLGDRWPWKLCSGPQAHDLRLP